jgi:hypothetical protein
LNLDVPGTKQVFQPLEGFMLWGSEGKEFSFYNPNNPNFSTRP